MIFLGTRYRPSYHGSLQLWFDALDYSSLTIEDTDRVTQWADKSGNARHASCPTSSVRRPTYSATGLNSRPCLSFDGVATNGNYLDNSGYTLPNSFTFFGVFLKRSQTTSGSINRPFLASKSLSAGPTVQSPRGNASPADSWGVYCQEGLTTGGGAMGCDLANNTPVVGSGTFTFGGGNVTVASWQNRNADTGGATASASTSWSAGFEIGGSSADANRKWNGNIGELLLYDRILTTPERWMVESYLAKRWGIALTL